MHGDCCFDALCSAFFCPRLAIEQRIPFASEYWNHLARNSVDATHYWLSCEKRVRFFHFIAPPKSPALLHLTLLAAWRKDHCNYSECAYRRSKNRGRIFTQCNTCHVYKTHVGFVLKIFLFPTSRKRSFLNLSATFREFSYIDNTFLREEILRKIRIMAFIVAVTYLTIC